MKYTRFEELPVWKAALDMADVVFKMTEDKAFRFKGDIANQIQRAALSVSNNIAEGFERGTTQELITFLYIARGSAGEVRSILCLLERMDAFAHLQAQVAELKAAAESVSRQIRGWADSIQQSEIKGQRYLTDQSRAGYQNKKSAEAFITQLKSIYPGHQVKNGAKDAHTQ